MTCLRIDLNRLEKDILREAKIIDESIVKIWEQTEIIIPKISEVENILLIGCGDSFFAAIFGQYLIENISKIRAYANNAYECYKYSNIQKDDLVIAISASGWTKATIDVARKAKEKGAKVLGLTCNKSSPLLKYVDEKIILDVYESVPVPTISSMGSLAALTVLSIWFGLIKNKLEISEYEEYRREIMMIGGLMEEIYALNRGIRKIAETVFEHGYDKVYFIGGGPNFATTLFGMAKLRELRLSHSIAFEIEEFLHYGNIPLGKNDFCLVIATGRSKKRLLDTLDLLKDLEVNTVCISDDDVSENTIVLPKINEFLSPLPGLLTIHLFALYLAKMKWGKHVEIEHGEKISQMIRLHSI